MQGNTTTRDLRLKAGLEDVQTHILHRQARCIGHVARYQDDGLERVVLGISSAIHKDEGGLRGVYWKRVSEVMEQLGYPEHEWSEKWIEAAKDRKRWRQGVSEVVKRYKQDVDYDTWENRHTEKDTSFEREVRQAIGELDDQGGACCPRCGGCEKTQEKRKEETFFGKKCKKKMKNIEKSKNEEMNKKRENFFLKKNKKKDKKKEKKSSEKRKRGPKGFYPLPRWAQKMIFHVRTVKRNRNEIEAQKKIRF